MVLKVVLEPSEEGGYTALVPAFPGCISEGDTLEEALRNVREAIKLCLEPADEDFPTGRGALGPPTCGCGGTLRAWVRAE
jgi:predicted RNase H-like HicB family nuclease